MAEGSMIPKANWNEIGKEFTEEQGTPLAQKIMCVTCAYEGVYDPPDKVIIKDGNSYCGTHYMSSLGLPHTPPVPRG